MKKTTLHTVLLTLSLFLFSACEQVGIEPTVTCTYDSSFSINENHPKAARATAIMEKYLALGIPGMSVLVHDDDGFWIASAGYADLENEI